VLDTSADYLILGDDIDGHFGNEEPNDTADDNATDILLVEGTSKPDRIAISEEAAIHGVGPAPATGLTSGPAEFTLTIDDPGLDAAVSSLVGVEPVGAGDFEPGEIVDLGTLARKITKSFEGTPLEGLVEAVRTGKRLSLLTRGFGRDATLTISDANDVTVNELKLLAAGEPSRDGVEQMVVDITSGKTARRTLFATWRDAEGVPLVEQLRISGLLGDDRIEFADGPNAPDFSDLNARSDDWVSWCVSGGTSGRLLRPPTCRARTSWIRSRTTRRKPCRSSSVLPA